MTRINSAISVEHLTDEHLLAEHREIKRLPNYLSKSISSGSINSIPKDFRLGSGHVLFFIDKSLFTYKRYIDIRKECIKRGFSVTDYSSSWNLVKDEKYSKDHQPTKKEKELLIERISERILNSTKPFFHYKGERITKQKAVELLCS